MSALLTENLPLIADAPDGIRKLRGLILELAVRGRLVPQDPDDEPASELLKRIASRKGAIEAKKGSRKLKPEPSVSGNERPFDLPDSWAWARLADLVQILNGRAYAKSELLDAGTPVLRVGNLFTSNHWYYSDLTLESDKYCDAGDLIYSWSASFGPFIWQGTKVIYHYHIWKLQLFDEESLSKEYLYKFLLEKTAEIKAAGHGVSMVHMTKEKMERISVPVPPLAEQNRIVAKVDELMALCDRLDAEQADAEAAHARLVDALLAALTRSTDAADFAANWQRLAAHFDTLFTTEAAIDALKQTVLQLAVMGKLVPQDPNDEPASELLKRITRERAQLEARRGYKKQRPILLGDVQEQPFDLPNGWVWAKFSQIATVNGRLVDSQDYPDLPQVAPDSIEKGTGRLIERRTVREAGIRGPNQRFQAGQLLYSKIRPSLSKAVIADFDGLCSADMYPLDSHVECRFLLNQILSELFLKQVRAAENRVKMPKLNQESLSAFLIAVPPLAEQHRIVAKVDELMALCDLLKAGLAFARENRARLADALVHTALQAA